MRIRVDCKGTSEPRAFYIGGRRLHVMRVLAREGGDSWRGFCVRVEDGRVFHLRHDTASGEWRLARVNSRARPANPAADPASKHPPEPDDKVAPAGRGRAARG